MLRVKICGIVSPADARAVAASGADALGLVFFPKSPRNVTPERAEEILDAVPPFVTRVGLFVNPEPGEVEAVLEKCALDVLQFHGDESPDLCRRFGRPYLKAVRVSGPTDLRPWQEHFADAQGLLVDRADAQVYGGSGRPFSWWPFPRDFATPLILAGGLHPGNVAEAVQIVRPYAVDVSSGVETFPGCKNPEKMAEFVVRARQAAGEP